MSRAAAVPTLLLTCLGALVAPVGAAAASRQDGTVAYVSADRTFGKGVVTAALTGAAATDRPSCASATDQRWALDISGVDHADQYIYSALLSAMGGGWRITVTGAGTCSTVPYLEDIAYVEVRRAP